MYVLTKLLCFSILFHPPLSRFSQSYCKSDGSQKYRLHEGKWKHSVDDCLLQKHVVMHDWGRTGLYWWRKSEKILLMHHFIFFQYSVVWLSVNTTSWFSILCQNSFGQSSFWYLQYMHLTSVKDIEYIKYILNIWLCRHIFIYLVHSFLVLQSQIPRQNSL